jgi:hypothetical protein
MCVFIIIMQEDVKVLLILNKLIIDMQQSTFELYSFLLCRYSVIIDYSIYTFKN